MDGCKWDFEPNMQYFGMICDRFFLKQVKVRGLYSPPDIYSSPQQRTANVVAGAFTSF